MLISLTVWIYISIVCLIWGHMSLSAIVKGPGTSLPPSSGLPPDASSPSFNTGLLCLAGLALISTLALGLSLFMPLDWKAHLLILLPAAIYCTRSSNRQTIGKQITDTTQRLSRPGILLLIVCIAMTATISAHDIIHPDTMYYHARSILLFDRYKAIPGIANLRNELGFQCSWFASLSLFKTNAPGYYNIIFLNGAVLCWYFLFIAEKISTKGWPWLLLFAYTLFSWTQIRLTAASPSPDFIVSLYSWAAIYAFLQKKDKAPLHPAWLSLVVLFCIAAVLTKLSPIAILPLAVIALLRSLRLRSARILGVYSFLALIILFIRNRIASGYLLYPLPQPDLFDLPWKLSLSSITHFQQYISLYARFPILHPETIMPLQSPFTQWVPRWWEHIDTIDRLLLLAILIGIALNGILLFLPSRRKRSNAPANGSTLVLLITLAGSLLWFIGAPSPRFGTGFLVPLLFLLYQRLPLPGITTRIPFSGPSALTAKIPVFLLATACITAAIAAYTGYRVARFSTPRQLLVPAGIIPNAYRPLGCDNISVDLLNNKMEIKGKGTVSCADPTGGFTPIGTTIAEGFKPPSD
jgi:hypothetical protein